MRLTMYQVDAFAERVFQGNPAAVCPLESWLPDGLLQAIAAENNLAETAFFVPAGDGYALRWFSPTVEVDLCGHATLASAYVLYEQAGYAGPAIRFHTRSGVLAVERAGEGLRMTFPAFVPAASETPAELVRGLGAAPSQTLAALDYLAVFETQEQVSALSPDFAELARLSLRGVIATAPGGEVDFVSRFFAPKMGISEDPVTGSAHCQLAPFWGERLGRTRLTARQISERGGSLQCEWTGDSVRLTGRAQLYMAAQITVPDLPW